MKSCVNVICSDKTGTMTRNEMTVTLAVTANLEQVAFEPVHSNSTIFSKNSHIAISDSASNLGHIGASPSASSKSSSHSLSSYRNDNLTTMFRSVSNKGPPYKSLENEDISAGQDYSLGAYSPEVLKLIEVSCDLVHGN
ncbi:unnamed protein product [Protopolystoma xenopodis]|uniref:Cation-transporting P-type ATPase C-terminal domain-containing protein n=1 Tax=Protopolystoma xenopodis TaxID=117903 RepID=A0A448WW35_9PLAT|nr:unnamed protein product [Protopolystoma xenopodis]